MADQFSLGCLNEFADYTSIDLVIRLPGASPRVGLVIREYPNFPANNVTYTYGAAAQRNPSASGNVVGRITRITHITDRDGTKDRLYGRLGEIVQETRAIPIHGNQIITYVTKSQYDTWNRVAQVTYPDRPLLPVRRGVAGGAPVVAAGGLLLHREGVRSGDRLLLLRGAVSRSAVLQVDDGGPGAGQLPERKAEQRRL